MAQHLAIFAFERPQDLCGRWFIQRDEKFPQAVPWINLDFTHRRVLTLTKELEYAVPHDGDSGLCGHVRSGNGGDGPFQLRDRLSLVARSRDSLTTGENSQRSKHQSVG